MDATTGMTKHYTDRQKLDYLFPWQTPSSVFWTEPDLERAMTGAGIRPEGTDEPTQEQIDKVLAYVEAQGWKCVPLETNGDMRVAIWGQGVDPFRTADVWEMAVAVAPKFKVKK